MRPARRRRRLAGRRFQRTFVANRETIVYGHVQHVTTLRHFGDDVKLTAGACAHSDVTTGELPVYVILSDAEAEHVVA